MTFTERLSCLSKLLHRRKENAASFPAPQQIDQIGTRVRFLWLLHQELTTTRKLTKELIIKIVSISDDNDGGSLDVLKQKVYEKHHR